MTGSAGTAQAPEERVAFLADGSVGVFVREDGGGWYIWRSSSLAGDPWLAEPVGLETHHPTCNAWRRVPEAD
jgi:hypothetical protein